MHESIRITDWFYIYFTENPGMAFGWEFFDKLFLTSFRIVAVAVIGYLLHRIIRKGVPTGMVVCVSLTLESHHFTNSLSGLPRDRPVLLQSELVL